MRKNFFYPLIMLLPFSSGFYAQVGINTATPASTLEVVAKNSTGTTTNVDGLLVPRVDRQRAQNMTTVPTSTLIYVNSVATGTQLGTAINIDAVGYYFYNGTAWVKMNAPVNIYTNDGSLNGNRIVTQAANTLSFTGTATNAFSVDGTTLSVDAANHRIGIGTTTPATKFHVEGAEVRLTNATSLWGLDPEGTAPNSQLSIVDGTNNVRRLILQQNGNAYLGGGIASGGTNATISAVGGSVGIGAVAAPTNTLDVNGTTRVRTITPVSGATIVTPVYSDANGVLVKASPSSTYGGVNSNSVSVASGATGVLISGLIDGGIYKIFVSNGDGCLDASVAEYYVTNFSFNNFFSINGLGGLLASGVANKSPAFTQTNRNIIRTVWTGKVGCALGDNSTALNYTLTIPAAGSINVTNNGNMTKSYTIVATRIN
jgi:hypothetical protein